MAVPKHQILTGLATIEREAPLFFGAIPVADELIRDIVASAMSALSASSDFQQASPRCREAALLASLTHALLETAHLRHQLDAIGEAATVEARRLLAKAAMD